MAFTNFYIDTGTGASALNAGTTSANAGGSSAAAFTYAGGTFVRATGVFTVASGNPASDGVTVGTYASIYTTSGATGTTFVAQITARDATTITVDITTLKWGVATSVSETAAATTCKVSGAWLNELPLTTITGTIPVSSKINIKQVTYTVTASRTAALAGATTTPIWFSGYNTTPGDLDNDTTNGLTKPTFAMNSTFIFTFSGAHAIFTSINFTGSRAGAILSTSGTAPLMVRCRSTNTLSNISAAAITVSASGRYAYCWFKSEGTNCVAVSSANYYGCIFENSVNGASFGANAPVMAWCIFLNNNGSSGGCAVVGTTGAIKLLGCSIINPDSDAIQWSSTPSAGAAVIGCLFWMDGSGIGIYNASGTDTNNVLRACNDYYNVGAQEAGFGDSPAFFGKTESADPFSGTNLTPIAGSNARNNGYPGVVEGKAYSSYLDIGAVQHLGTGGGFTPQVFE